MGESAKDVTAPKGKPGDGVSKTTVNRVVPVTIAATASEFVVVLDKSGAARDKFPILSFDVTGPPGWMFEVQVGRKNPSALTEAPGLKDAWDKNKGPLDRVPQTTFSSWTNGETGLTLDGTGKAKYTMPLDWWKDQARQRRKDFTNTPYFFRAVGFQDKSGAGARFSTSNGQKPPSVKVNNNLVSFDVSEKYDPNEPVKNALVKITTREDSTWNMYCIVQWVKGENKVKTDAGNVHFGSVTSYGISHETNLPEWSIDSLDTDPRAGNGDLGDDDAHPKIAVRNDRPGGKIMRRAEVLDFNNLDFKDTVHLNCDVEGKKVRIAKQTGEAPVFEQVIGVLPDPQPAILDEIHWKVRILQARQPSGKVIISHPDNFIVR
jgi:hypothetical protein